MKKIILFTLIVLSVLSCKSKKNYSGCQNHFFPNIYNGEMFSLEYPEGWEVDDSEWHGEDSLQNELQILPPIPTTYNRKVAIADLPCWVHCVKRYLHIPVKTAKEAAELSKAFTPNNPNNGFIGIVEEVDSLVIDGKPTYLIIYAYRDEENNDTIINKQYNTILPKSHTIFMFNSNFSIKDDGTGEEIGNKIIKSIKFKTE